MKEEGEEERERGALSLQNEDPTPQPDVPSAEPDVPSAVLAEPDDPNI